MPPPLRLMQLTSPNPWPWAIKYRLCTWPGCWWSRGTEISKFWFLVFIKSIQELTEREFRVLMEVYIYSMLYCSYLELHKCGQGGVIIISVLGAFRGHIMSPSLLPIFNWTSPRNIDNLFPKKSFFPRRQSSRRTKFSHQYTYQNTLDGATRKLNLLWLGRFGPCFASRTGLKGLARLKF